MLDNRRSIFLFLSVNCNTEFWRLSSDLVNCVVTEQPQDLLFLNWDSMVLDSDS